MLGEVQRVTDKLSDGLRALFTAKSSPLTPCVEASHLKYGGCHVMSSLKFDGDGSRVCRVCRKFLNGDQLGR